MQIGGEKREEEKIETRKKRAMLRQTDIRNVRNYKMGLAFSFTFNFQ